MSGQCRRIAALAVLLLAMPALFAIDATPPLPDPVKQERYLRLIHELRCLKCQGETVADTPAEFAIDIRRQVREMVEAGSTDGDVRQYMVDRYGEIILLKPRWSLANSWLWLGPGILLLGGGYVAARVLRQRQRLLAADNSVVDEESRRT
ncbi:MAG: cytochrome c-type biogenesis protein [Steroidobacteraceae bacterium]